MKQLSRRDLLNLLGKHLLVLIGFACPVLVLHLLFGRGCIVYLLTGVHCPFCGMTRACLAALRFDFSAAFHYHPLFWLGVPYLFLFFHERECPKKYRKVLKTAIISISLLFILTYFIRLFGHYLDF